MLNLLDRSWSYGVNLTLIGNAVFVSMDIPDVFFAVRLSPIAANHSHTLVTDSPPRYLNYVTILILRQQKRLRL